MMKPEEIKERREMIRAWAREAQAKVDALDEDSRAYLRELIDELSRKTSKRLADHVAGEIGEFLGMDNPLRFCVTWKWEGFFGLSYVLGQTVYALRV